MRGPFNAVSGKAYSGGNVDVLLDAIEEHGFQSMKFCTFMQAIALGRPVPKGEHACAQITKYVSFKKKGAKKGSKPVLVPRTYSVWNLDQLPEAVEKEAV
jgi:antirestriction protein ArdC